MKWTRTHLYTLKEAPADAEIPSHKLMVRGGFIKKLAPGLYTYGAMTLRALRKFENIIREELNQRGCTEILMPVVQPRELWEETSRWTQMGAGLLKFKNRNEHWFCLGATHEEAVVDYIRNDLKSYKDLPKNIYQIQTKYRDEIRPRFGLMRGREFTMKDAYSFDGDMDSALKTYRQMYEAYQAIFDRLGLDYRIVKADAGNIGGSQTHEFQLLAEAGEDAILVSDTTSFAANVEVCPALDFTPRIQDEKEKQPEEFATPGQRTIADLSQFTGLPETDLVKTLFFDREETAGAKSKPFAVLYRGSDEANLIKIKNFLAMANAPRLLSDAEVRELTGADPGSCGPVGLKVPVYLDRGVEGLKNIIVGANRDGFHLKNINFPRDFKPTDIVDLRMARPGDRCPESSGRLVLYRGIEVGHVFYLGRMYSEKMKAYFLDASGKSQAFEMGCYGIGVTRTIQACIEQSHDKDGIVWPESLAPYDIHVCLLDREDSTSQSVVENLELRLKALGREAFIDDRNERPGVKFMDADLLGMPLRVVIGKRGLEKGEIEVVWRKSKELKRLSPERFFEALVPGKNLKQVFESL